MPRLKDLSLAFMPVAFVLLWSTGFIGAKYGLPYAEPFTFLFIRFIATLLVLLLIIRLSGTPWPRQPRLWLHIGVTGALVHASYLGGVFYGISLGMPAGLTALIVGLQPLLTAIIARPWLGENISGRQWTGIVLGLTGISLVLSDKLAPTAGELFSGFGPEAIAPVLIALLGISVGTLYQKRHCTGMPLLTGTFIQYLAAALLLGVGALLFETRTVVWTPSFIYTLAWLVFGLSIAAILLLMTLIRLGAASRVASLFYLVPPVTALEAWILFGETLGALAIGGIAVTVIGVALAVHRPEHTAPPPAREAADTAR